MFTNMQWWILVNWIICSITPIILWTRQELISTFYLKEINPEYSLEGLMIKLKLRYFGHLIWRANWLEKRLMLGKTEGRRRREQQGDEMVKWHHWLNGHEFEQTPGDSEGQGILACCTSQGRKESDMTGWLNNNDSGSQEERTDRPY